MVTPWTEMPGALGSGREIKFFKVRCCLGVNAPVGSSSQQRCMFCTAIFYHIYNILSPSLLFSPPPAAGESAWPGLYAWCEAAEVPQVRGCGLHPLQQHEARGRALRGQLQRGGHHCGELRPCLLLFVLSVFCCCSLWAVWSVSRERFLSDSALFVQS